MTTTLATPLAPFADALPVPRRLVAAEQNGRLSVPIRAGVHRFHRDLPESAIWGYDGTVPGPTIEAERGEPVTVTWRNELEGTFPVVVTTAPVAAETSGVPVQSVPGLSGGTIDQNAAALAGHTVVHVHGALVPASYDGWAENLFAPGQDAVFHYPMGHLQRALHVPLPHPRTRRPRHDAPVCHHARRTHAVHGLTGRPQDRSLTGGRISGKAPSTVVRTCANRSWCSARLRSPRS